MKVEAQLTYAQIRHDQAKDAHLVLSLTAPPLAQETKRQPICVIAAIDVSPSMEEGQKLAYAKQSAIKLVDNLQPGDYFGLVDFAQSAHLVIKPTKVTAAFKDQAKRQVGALRVRNATNIADALLVSLDAANKMDLGAEIITRCILFTDGDANTGVAIAPKAILDLLSKNLGIATVSAFGYGADVKQDLLADIARMGKANYAFVKNPDDALSAFGKELGGLISTWATNVQIDLAPLADEHRFTSVVSDVEAEEDVVGHMTVKFPDLLAEETRHIVLGVNLGAQKAGGPRPVNVFEVKIQYDIIGADGRKERKTTESRAKVQFVKAGEEQTDPTKAIDEIVAQAQIVRAQIEAEKAAQRGDFKTAGSVLKATSMSVHRRGLAPLGNVTGHLSQMYASPDAYRATAGNRVGMRSAMTRAVGTSGLDKSDEAVLSSAHYGMSNSSQDAMVTSFTSDQSPMSPPPAVIGTPVASPVVQGDLTGLVQPMVTTGSAVAPIGLAGVVPGWGAPLAGRRTHGGSMDALKKYLDESVSNVRADATPPATQESSSSSSPSKRKPLKQTKSSRW